MKKIDRLFIQFPELKLMERWIRTQLKSKSKHPINWVYKRYTLRKPNYFYKATDIINNSQENIKLVWADMYLDYFYAGTALLNHLNNCFGELKNKTGFLSMLKNLKNPKQFFNTISELEFNGYFANRYPLTLEPKLTANGFSKKLDSKINLAGRDILFEITTPDSYELLKKSKEAIVIPNRSKAKFLDKLQRQIIPIKEVIKGPLIIVLNASYSDIDEYDVMDAILGQFRFNMIVDKKSGKMIDEYEDRDTNSLIDKEPLADYISAVIVYKRQIKYNGIFYSKSIIENKKSRFPLNSSEYKKLGRLDFRKISSKILD